MNPKATDQQGFQYGWGNRTASLRWTHVFTPRLFSNFWVTYSSFNSEFDLDLYRVNEKNSINDLTLKGKLEYHFSDHFASRFGFEQKMLDLDYYFDDIGMIVDIHQNGNQSALYGILNWTPTIDWDIELGLRYTHFKLDQLYQDWAPRFSAKYRLTDTMVLRAAAGRYYQYLHRIPRLFIIDIWTISNKYQERAKSNHFQFGFQQEISNDYEFEVDAFYKDYKNIYSFNHNVGADIQANGYSDDERPLFTNMNNLFDRGDGNSYGFELLLRKDKGRVRGWLGYAYSHTEYKIDGINQNRWFMPRHDRTSTINAMANIDLFDGKNKLILGTNFVYSTGQPLTEPGSAYLSSSGPFANEINVNYAPTKINNIRLPDYIRLDLSLTYQIHYRGWMMAPYLQIYNIGNRGNVWFVSYEYENGKPLIEEQYMLPLLPTLGVNFTF
jgi:outer membrane receptor protein involved in Fe transport